MRSPRQSLLRAVVIGSLAVAALAGCTANDALAQQATDGSNKNYISGDGTVTEIKPADRAAPIEFSSKTDKGAAISRSSYQGQVVVLNFWYASCAPCRIEARDLEALSTKYQNKGVQFIGVNVRDEVDTSQAFARSFKITYPSIADVSNAKVQLALGGERGPNATPTTIVLDRQGRVAARILGEANKSVLDQLIVDTLHEAH